MMNASSRSSSEQSFEGVDIALFSVGGVISKHFAPIAVKAGAGVIANSSPFRMEAAVPLIVPEVNGESLGDHRGIIANPRGWWNCSPMLVPATRLRWRDRIGSDGPWQNCSKP
jgi:aspartate-semialdehyde dehydrogenase